MDDLEKEALIDAVITGLVAELGEAVVVARRGVLSVDLVFFDMIPGRVSATPDGLRTELLVGAPDEQALPWEPQLDRWDVPNLPSPGRMAQVLAVKVYWALPDRYLDVVFPAAYTWDRWTRTWRRTMGAQA